MLLKTLFAGLLLATAAAAQIVPITPGRQRAETRRALRDAQRADAPYKDSHLDVTRRQLRRGAAQRPTRIVGEPRFGHDGTPHVTEPKFPGLRRRPKTEPNP